jgi:hypothetical protein
MSNKTKERSKFNVSAKTEKRTVNDILFDSELEAKYYRDYVLPLMETGEIIKYEIQPRYLLQEAFRHDGKQYRKIEYVADFLVEYKDGQEVIVDIKGMATETAKLKKKWFLKLYPNKKLQWINFSKIDGGWVEIDVINANRKKRKGIIPE